MTSPKKSQLSLIQPIKKSKLCWVLRAPRATIIIVGISISEIQSVNLPFINLWGVYFEMALSVGRYGNISSKSPVS